MEKIESTRSKVNPYYDMRVKDLQEIYENSQSVFDCIANGFRFGYLQGVKAAKAEIRKYGDANA